jgi:hypothetical protein
MAIPKRTSFSIPDKEEVKYRLSSFTKPDGERFNSLTHALLTYQYHAMYKAVRKPLGKLKGFIMVSSNEKGGELDGDLIECPDAIRAEISNKICSCGENMDKAKDLVRPSIGSSTESEQNRNGTRWRFD